MFDCYRDVPLTFKMVGTMFTKFNIGELFNGSLLSIVFGAYGIGYDSSQFIYNQF